MWENTSGTRNSLEPYLNKQNTLAQIGPISISKVTDWSLGRNEKSKKKNLEENFIQGNISSLPLKIKEDFICMC